MEGNGNSIIITKECFEEESESPEFDDNLSFSNLEMQSPRNLPSSSSSSAYDNNDEEEIFEFSTATAPEIIRDDLIEYQKRDYLTNNFGGKKIDLDEKDDDWAGKILSSANHRSMMMMKRNLNNYRSIDQNNKKVNITSLTSMSAKSRRRMFMFGPVKFNPEMELSSLRERQSWGRFPTKLMFPLPVDLGEKTTSSVISGTAGDGGKPVSTTRSRTWKISSQWGLLVRSFRGRSPITTALSKLFGCLMTPTRVGVEKWIRVAN